MENPEKPDRRAFLGAMAGGAGAVALHALSNKVDTSVSAPQEEETDPRYNIFLKSVEEGDMEVIQAATEQIKAYSDEFHFLTQTIRFLEDKLAHSKMNIRPLTEMNLQNYRIRADFVKKMIQDLSDPIRQYLEKNPDVQPMPNPGVSNAKMPRTGII